jgi:hypothetical protein
MTKLKLAGKARLCRYGVKTDAEGDVKAVLSLKLEPTPKDVCLDVLSESDSKFASDMLGEDMLTRHKVDLKDRGLVGQLGIDEDQFEFVGVKLESIDLAKKFVKDDSGRQALIEWTFNFSKDMEAKDNALTQAFLNRKEEQMVEAGKNRDGSPKTKPKMAFVYVSFNFKCGV